MTDFFMPSQKTVIQAYLYVITIIGFVTGTVIPAIVQMKSLGYVKWFSERNYYVENLDKYPLPNWLQISGRIGGTTNCFSSRLSCMSSNRAYMKYEFLGSQIILYISQIAC